MADYASTRDQAILPYLIADAIVPLDCDTPEGRDVIVAIAGLSIDEIMHPSWHAPSASRIYGVARSKQAPADGDSNGR